MLKWESKLRESDLNAAIGNAMQARAEATTIKLMLKLSKDFYPIVSYTSATKHRYALVLAHTSTARVDRGRCVFHMYNVAQYLVLLGLL